MNPSLTKSTEESSRLGLVSAALVWLISSTVWLRFDRLLRDGDEEGHVGAAELFMGDLNSQHWGAFFERLWIGPMGEYPQAFSAAVGAWWWATGGGLPGSTRVRFICLIFLMIAAYSTARIARRYAPQSQSNRVEAVAFITVLLLPLANGLTRHFMPESALIAVVAASLLIAHRLVERPSIPRAIQLGIVLGVGLLTKQTFIILVGLPVIWTLNRLGRQSFRLLAIAAFIALLIAGPWWFSNVGEQWAYSTQSIGNRADGGLLDHLLFYPISLVFTGLGPFLTVASIWAAVILRKQPDRRAWMFGAVWLIGGLILLTIIPKKYPRLIAPLTPAIAIWVSVLWVRTTRSRWLINSLGIASLGTVIWGSLFPLPTSPSARNIDPGCTQHWLRPMASDDHGFAIAQTLLATQPPGAILVEKDYAIPCEVQTTHDWSNHLAPYLRRSGMERHVHHDPEKPHRFILRVGPEQGSIPIWGQSVHLDIRDKVNP